jgi:hypothetical protein
MHDRGEARGAVAAQDPERSIVPDPLSAPSSVWHQHTKLARKVAHLARRLRVARVARIPRVGRRVAAACVCACVRVCVCVYT